MDNCNVLLRGLAKLYGFYDQCLVRHGYDTYLSLLCLLSVDVFC